jgi:hypothetical protein
VNPAGSPAIANFLIALTCSWFSTVFPLFTDDHMVLRRNL